MQEELTLKDMEGARNLIDFCDVKKGERVLLMKGEETHPIVLKAIELAILERGGFVSIIECKEGPRVYGAYGTHSAYNILSKAYYGCEIAIKLGTIAGGLFIGEIEEARMDYGVSYVMADVFSPEGLRSEYFRYPIPLLALIGEKVYQLLLRKEEKGVVPVHVTSPNGTDYMCYTNVSKYGVSGITKKAAKMRRPGEWIFFPDGIMCVGPVEGGPKGGGTFIADYLPAWTCPGTERNHLLKNVEPPTFYIEDDWVTEIKGAYSDEILELIETQGDKFSRFCGGPMWALHPKARGMGTTPFEIYYSLHTSPLMAHLHIGLWGWGGRSGARFSKYLTLPFCYKPTIEIGGEAIIKDGDFTELILDNEVWEEASKYGDPEKLLSIEKEAYEELFAFRYSKKS